MVVRRSAVAGFTLIEMVLVMVIVGILSAYAIVKNASSSSYAIKSQADKFAASLRHVQSLATTTGHSLTVTAIEGENGSYTVACTTVSASWPCNSTPVIDPATGTGFTVALQQKASLTASPTTFSVSNFGAPSTTATFTVSSGGAIYTIVMSSLAGNVVVTP